MNYKLLVVNEWLTACLRFCFAFSES